MKKSVITSGPDVSDGRSRAIGHLVDMLYAIGNSE